MKTAFVITWAIVAAALSAISWAQMHEAHNTLRQVESIQRWIKGQCTPDIGEEARSYYYTGADGNQYLGCEKSPVKAWGMVK